MQLPHLLCEEAAAEFAPNPAERRGFDRRFVDKRREKLAVAVDAAADDCVRKRLEERRCGSCIKKASLLQHRRRAL